MCVCWYVYEENDTFGVNIPATIQHNDTHKNENVI